MHSFATVAAVSATLISIANAIPLTHGPKHARLHAARGLTLDAEPQVVKLAPVLAERTIPTVQLDLMGGTCGGSTGYGCAEGFCCSKWGYCGQGPLYCSGNVPVSNGTALSAPASSAVSIAGKDPGWGPPSGYPISWGAPASSSDNDLPSYTPPASAPAYSSPPETSAAPAPATSSQAPAPAPSSYAAPPASSAAPAPASSAPTPPPYEPQPSTPASSGGDGLGDVYKMYSGNGSPSDGWPSEDQWASFDDSWNANVDTIRISCAQFGQENPKGSEVDDIKSAITEVAAESGVDSRFILAIMMQESKGCVRVPTTSWSHANPGLFQSFEGTGTCNPDGTGIVPCPANTIKQMVSDGVMGTQSGPGLKQNLAECQATGSQKYYEAARIYNAGSLVGNDLGAPGATECYCTDVANRLTGWTTAASGCTLG